MECTSFLKCELCLHAELVHQPAQFYHQVRMRPGGEVSQSPKIHSFNFRGSTPHPHPGHSCVTVCVVGGGEGKGVSGRKGSLQDPSDHPSRLQMSNKAAQV